MFGFDRSNATPGISSRSIQPLSIAGGPNDQTGNWQISASASRSRRT